MLKKLEIIKQMFLKSVVFSLGLSLVMPMSVFAIHQGSQPIYAHFGQPHGYIVSGDFTFILQVHGKIDRAIFKVTEATNVNTVLVTKNQTSITPGTNGDSYYNLVLNSSEFADGNYWLFADIENDTATPNGWRDFARHFDNKNHLEFSVKNPVVTPPAVTQPPEDTCSTRLVQAKKLATQVYDKQNTSILFIDNFMQQTTLFYEKKLARVQD